MQPYVQTTKTCPQNALKLIGLKDNNRERKYAQPKRIQEREIKWLVHACYANRLLEQRFLQNILDNEISYYHKEK